MSDYCDNVTLLRLDGRKMEVVRHWEEPFEFAVGSAFGKREVYPGGKERKVRCPDGHRYAMPIQIAEAVESHFYETVYPDKLERARALFARGHSDTIDSDANMLFIVEKLGAGLYREIEVAHAEPTPKMGLSGYAKSGLRVPSSALPVPPVLVSFPEFAEACRISVEQGRFSRSFAWYMLGTRKRRKKADASKAHIPVLSQFNVETQAGGLSFPCRLDHALASMKLAPGNIDWRGQEVLGAMPCVASKQEGVIWRTVYELDGNGESAERGRGSIDHVVPKAAGGADRLLNMQMTRCATNWNKADTLAGEYLDIEATLDALDALACGIGHMDDAEGQLKAALVKLLRLESESLARHV